MSERRSAADRRGAPWRRWMAGWLALAALGHLVYLFRWPMYVGGVAAPYPAAVGIALARIGLYSGLAWALARGERGARAAAVLELWRSFLLFAAHAALAQWTLPGAFYPGGWSQGLLAAALPALVVVNTAVALGWRPGALLEEQVATGARVLALGTALAALGLRRAPEPAATSAAGPEPPAASESAPACGAAAPPSLPELLREGGPLLAPLLVVELAALWLAGFPAGHPSAGALR